MTVTKVNDVLHGIRFRAPKPQKTITDIFRLEIHAFRVKASMVRLSYKET